MSPQGPSAYSAIKWIRSPKLSIHRLLFISGWVTLPRALQISSQGPAQTSVKQPGAPPKTPKNKTNPHLEWIRCTSPLGKHTVGALVVGLTLLKASIIPLIPPSLTQTAAQPHSFSIELS